MNRGQALAALQRTDDELAARFSAAETEGDENRMEAIRQRL